MSPRPVLEFLAQHWIKYLVVTHVRDGAESGAWKRALGIVDQLVWSVSPKSSTEERRKLASVVPALLKEVKAGLNAAEVEDAVAFAFFKDLIRCHTAAIQIAPPQPAPSTEAKQPVEAPVRDAVGAEVKAAIQSAVQGALSIAPEPLPKAPPTNANKAIARTGTPAPAKPTTAATPASASARGAPSVAPPVSSKVAPSVAPAQSIAPPMAGALKPRVPSSTSARHGEPPPIPGNADDLNFVAPIVAKNPFGEGKVRVDDLDFTVLLKTPSNPSGPAVAAQKATIELPPGIALGCWVEITGVEGSEGPTPAKLQYVSPLESHFLSSIEWVRKCTNVHAPCCRCD